MLSTVQAKLLIVDDLPENLLALEALIKREDRQVFKALSADEALSLLLEHEFARLWSAAYDYAIFDKTLRENVTFADHSLATDSVFSETQLISCRNVLIYFNKKLQDRAFGLFHESLCHRGFLVLGSKETLDFSAYSKQFEPLVKQERIYRKS